MTDNELLRIKLIQDICDKRITGVEAARILRLSSRQVYRLLFGLNSPSRRVVSCKPSNR